MWYIEEIKNLGISLTHEQEEKIVKLIEDIKKGAWNEGEDQGYNTGYNVGYNARELGCHGRCKG
jgi:hypothetical protein